MTAQDVIAAVVYAHQYKGTIAINRPSLMVQCSCGHEEPCAPRQGRIAHSAHVAAEITAAGYAVVKLPEPVRDHWGDLVWPTGVAGGYVRIAADGRIGSLSISNPAERDEAEAQAAALLAATAHAEAGEHGE